MSVLTSQALFAPAREALAAYADAVSGRLGARSTEHRYEVHDWQGFFEIVFTFHVGHINPSYWPTETALHWKSTRGWALESPPPCHTRHTLSLSPFAHATTVASVADQLLSEGRATYPPVRQWDGAEEATRALARWARARPGALRTASEART